MTFLAPVWLVLGGLAVAILVLHMRRRRQLDVPSVLLWRLIDNAGAARRALRWPPPSLLLALQILIVLLVAVALAQPMIGANRGTADHTIYLLDSSASMRATDTEPSRFENAVETLAERIAAIDPQSGNRFSIISVGPTARVDVARQTEAAAAAAALDRVEAIDGPADWRGAAALVPSLLAADETPTVIILTDGADTGDAAVAEALPGTLIERIVVGDTGVANLGLTAVLTERDAAAGQWRINGGVTFTGVRPPTAVTVRLLFQPEGATSFVALDETEVSRGTVVNDGADPIAPREYRFEMNVDLPGAGTLRLEIPDDAGPQDNEVLLSVRTEPVGARVLYLGPQTLPVVAALQAFEGIELLTAEQLPANDATFDLVIVDNVTVSRQPATNVLWLGTGRVAGRPAPTPLQTPTVTGWDTTHALALGVTWAGIAPEIGYRTARMEGATVLLGSGDVPLVQARLTPAGREVRVSFDIAGSNWPDLSSFPVFIANVVRWTGVEIGTVMPASCQVGVPCGFEARFVSGTIYDENGNAVWSTPTAGRASLLAGIENTFIPTRAGLYRVELGDETRQIAVNGDIAREINLTPVEDSEFTEPAASSTSLWWLALFLALILLVAETLLAGRGSEQFLRRAALHRSNPLSTRRRWMLGVRVAGVVFMLAAVLGLPWLALEATEEVVVVMGTDLGQGTNADRNRVLQQVADAADAGGARGGVITAGDNTQLTDIAAVGAIEAPATTAPAANLEAGLALAAATNANRVVLAADGNETEGDIARTVALLAERGIAVDIRPVNDIPPGEVWVEQITAPSRVFAGDMFTIQAVIFAQREGPAHVTVRRAGEVILEGDQTLLNGRTMIQTPAMPAGEEGALLIEVTVEAEGDTYAENNTNGAMIPVEPTPTIAIITEQPTIGDYFAGALEVQGMTAEILAPADAPTTLAGWLEYDEVVLMNVPAIRFNTENQEYLEQFVRVYGRGLLILGGENSFGPGGYYQTPFETMSPLSARIEHQAPEVAIVFVLDRSSSMGGMIGDRTRLDIAKEATVTAISLMHPAARVGIVVFDSVATPLVLPTTERDDEYIRQQLLPQVVEAGGTNMDVGLQMAVNMIAAVDSATKHIVVLTDGATNAGDFDAIIRAAQQANISISAVGINAGNDRRLSQIADLTGGVFHQTDDFRALPAILSQETMTLANAPFQAEPGVAYPVEWVDRNAPFLTGLPDQFPPLYAFVQTTLQPGADLHMQLTQEETTHPLMASWRYGNGHVLALATHGAGAGTAEWIQMPEYPLMWSQILRHFLPDTEGTGLNVALERVGDVIEVTAEVRTPDGAPMANQNVAATLDGAETPLTLYEAAPGQYVGEFAVAAGAHTVAVTAGDLAAEASTYIAYPARYDFGRADFDRLAALAAATGGEVLIGNDPIFSGDREWVAKPGWRIWALVGLILFMLDLTIRHAPALFGLRRMARRSGPALAVPAE